MESNQELYKEQIKELLQNYRISKELDEFLEKMIHVSFGVEQIKRGVIPFDFRFYAKSNNYLESLIRKLENKSDQLDDAFRIIKNNEYYFISCKAKSYGCKNILIYRKHFKNSDHFFKNVDLKFDFNYLTYDYVKNEIFARDEKLLEYRIENYNRDINDQFMNDIRELFCEDDGNEWAYC